MKSLLHWADYLILIGFLSISLAIGIYHSLTGGRQKTTAEFILANRRLKVIPTAISLLVSVVSAILLIGTTAETYSYGIQHIIYFTLSVAVALVFVERLIVPWLYPLKLVSVFEYLERRFMSKSMRIFGATLGVAMAVFFMGVTMYAPSAALQSATGVPLSVSIPAMAVVAVTYTALGGMRAVIWTDVFQFVTMLIGMVAILVKGLIVVGGITNVFRLADEEGRLIWANFSIDPRERTTVWSLMFGMGIAWINLFGLSQAAVQRYSAVDQLSKARKTILLIIPPIVIMDIMAGIIALIVLAYYSSIKCDPLANKDIANTNMLLPYFVVSIFTDSPGFAGIFLATLYGGTLSSLSSMLSGSAANVWEDMLQWKLSRLTETRKTLINQILVVFFGVLITGVAFLSTCIPGPIIQILVAVYSSATGPLIALFFLGAVSEHANWKRSVMMMATVVLTKVLGALVGGIVGVLVTLWLAIGSMTVSYKHPHLPPLSVEHCSIGNSNSTFIASSLNYTSHTYFEVENIIQGKSNWNQTTVDLPDAERQVHRLRGLEHFYAMSYLWFIPFGAALTVVIGLIASLIMRDRDLEEKVDERLLLRFRGCGWEEENETQEHVDDGNGASLQETKGLAQHEDRFFNSLEMTVRSKTENGFSNGKQSGKEIDSEIATK